MIPLDLLHILGQNIFAKSCSSLIHMAVILFFVFLPRSGFGTSAPPAEAGDFPLKSVILENVHPLHGGHNLYLLGSGKGVCQVVAWSRRDQHFREKRFFFTLQAKTLHELSDLITANSFFDIHIEERAGVPDEAKPTITVSLETGETRSVSKWVNDKHKNFDPIYRALKDIVRSVQNGNPIYTGKYDLTWMPDGF